MQYTICIYLPSNAMICYLESTYIDMYYNIVKQNNM